MALSSFQLFLNQVQSSPEELKVKVLHIIFDLLMVYDREFFGRSDDIVNVVQYLGMEAMLMIHLLKANRIMTFLLQTLETEESNAVQAVLCIGITKLLISGIVTDPRVRITFY
jgi:condensin complex subunit 3